MTNTLEDNLRSMYHDRSAHLPTDGPGLDAPAVVALHRAPVARRRGTWLAVAAALVVGTIGGVVATRHQTARIGTNDTGTDPRTAGRLTFDPIPPGFAVGWVDDGTGKRGGLPVPDPKDQRDITRIYARPTATPETGPVLIVDSYGDDYGVLEDYPSTARSIDVGGTPGKQWERDGRSFIAVHRDGYWFNLKSSGVSNPVAVAAGMRRASDNYGAVVDPAALPEGVVELAAGRRGSADSVFNAAAMENPTPFVSWGSTTSNAGLSYVSFVESPSEFLARRVSFGYSSMSDISIDDHAGVLFTVSVDFGARSTDVKLVWNDGHRTVLMTASNVPADDVVAAARSLRPATADEWRAMKSEAKRTQLAQEEAIAKSDATSVPIAPTTTRVVPTPLPPATEMKRAPTPVAWPAGVTATEVTASLTNYADHVTLLPPESDAVWLTAWHGVVDGIVCFGLKTGPLCLPETASGRVVVVAEGGSLPIALLQAPLGTRLMRGVSSNRTVNVAFADFGKSAYGTVLLADASANEPIVFTLPNGDRVSLQIDPDSMFASWVSPAEPPAWVPQGA
jgi:hypothetical protein